MKIVVTGGAGFIGSHIVQYWVKQNAEVHVIDNLRTGKEENINGFKEVIFHNESITNIDAVDSILKNADYVFNLAALVSVPESIIKPKECIEINVFGLLSLLEAAKRNNVKKVVHSSSAAVYGDNPVLPKTTNMKPEPKSPYGITKLDGEYYCNMYTELYGLETVSLRYFNVFGPRQDPKSQYAAAIPIFINKALNNEDISIFGDGSQTRDFIYVKDIVKANILAATKKGVTGVFNAANGRSSTVLEIAEKIIELTNSKSKLVFLDEREGDIKFSWANISETIKQLNFEPNNNIEDELLQTIKFFN